MARFLTIIAVLALVSAPVFALAQEENAAETVAEATTDEASAPEEADAADEPAVEHATEEEPAEPAAEEPSEEPAEEPEVEAESSDDDEAEDADQDEADDAEADEESIDWAGVIERFPPFFAVMHRAAVHMPIALWILGAVFVLVGVVVPSWSNQIPLACLIGGAMCALPAAASGWWNAEHEYGDEWAFSDLTDGERLSEAIVMHRWMAVALVISSVILSVIALVNQRKKSKGWGFVWRVGLLVLAAAVAWEGHIGGEMTVGEDFFEEALNELFGVDWFTEE